MFSDEEKKYLNDNLGLNLDFNNMSSEDWVKLEDTVGDRLTLHCLDKDYNPNEEGLMCERILNKLR